MSANRGKGEAVSNALLGTHSLGLGIGGVVVACVIIHFFRSRQKKASCREAVAASHRHLRTSRQPLSGPWLAHQCSAARHRRLAIAFAQSEQKEKASPTKVDANSSATESETAAQAAARLAAEIVASPIFYIVAGLLCIKLVSASGEQSASIFVFAALPITALTALSKSSLGKEVQANLEKRLPELQAAAAELKGEHEEARQRSSWFGADRPRLPGALGAAPHLTGQVAGDQGFDPLGLSADPATFARNYEAELLHARWAMLGSIGCVVPEALSLSGVELGEPIWWKVGAAKLQDDLTFNWGGIEGFRIAGKQGIGLIAACQVVLMGGPEYARQVGIRSLEPVGVFLPGDTNYPGGAPFDPLGFSQRPDEFIDQTVKEIRHGRIAMVAMLGFAVQAAVTRQGPVQNLLDFMAEPAHNNVFARLTGQ